MWSSTNTPRLPLAGTGCNKLTTRSLTVSPPSLQSRMDVGEVFCDTGSVVEQARANHAVADTPVAQHGDVVGFDPPVHLDLDRSATSGDLFVNGLGEAANFCFHVRDEGLTTKARIDAHDEDQINF